MLRTIELISAATFVIGVAVSANTQAAENDNVEPAAISESVLSPAPAPKPFGSKGQFYILGGPRFSYSSSSTSSTANSPGSGSYRSVSGDAELGAFAKSGLSLGLRLSYGRTLQSNDDPVGSYHYSSGTDNYFVGAQVGWHHWFAPAISFWPRLGLGGSISKWRNSQTNLDYGETSSSQSWKNLTAELILPIVFHPTRHFFLEGAMLVLAALGTSESDHNASVSMQPYLGMGFWL